MKNLVQLFVLSILFGLFGSAGAGDYAAQKVVYHINSDDPQQNVAALRNVQNHINAVGADNIEIRVVMHGNGLAMLIEPEALKELPKFKHANADDNMTARIAGLKNQGVQFKVCGNTVRGRDVDIKQHLYDVSEADIVPSGVAEIAKLEQEGYVYLKP